MQRQKITQRQNKAYWKDSEWANSHMQEISREYAGHWVAIADRKVVTAGKQLDDVISETEKKIGRKDFPIYFVEGKLCVY